MMSELSNQQIRQLASMRPETEPDHEFDRVIFSSSASLNTSDNSSQKLSLFSFQYRLVKTGMLIAAWISFGLNYEMIGPTFEDLKVYLEINYTQISFGLVLRNLGYMGLSLALGVVFDKVSHFSDLLMALSSVVIGLSKNSYKIQHFLSKILSFLIFQILFFLKRIFSCQFQKVTF
jgi:fucose permease